jgi:protein-tyrosine-phosphatase
VLDRRERRELLPLSLTPHISSVIIDSMSTERSAVERRAARHAALADPARLRIVDLLSLGDQSPTEIQHALGMTSNLLAHHLKVLEAEDMIARRRSEGDGRRSYVQLRPDALAGLGAPAHPEARRVVFVCTANSARSQLAVALWRRASAVPADSAGTRPAPRIDPGALSAARRHGIQLTALPPRALADVLDDDDFVITVCDNAHEELRQRPDMHWSVPDPVRLGTDDAFETALTELSRRVDDLAPRLTLA